MVGYVELQIASNYFFLRGARRIEELLLQAKSFGYSTLAITDHNTFAGIARAHARTAKAGIRLVVGCRLDLRGGPFMSA
jgi:error-prone DNA polymerase